MNRMRKRVLRNTILVTLALALALVIVILIYNTEFGRNIIGFVPTEVWFWLHEHFKTQGAESGYDLEFVLMCVLSLIVAAGLLFGVVLLAEIVRKKR